MSRHKTLLVASKFLRSNARASVSFIALWALTACGGSSTPNPQASLSTSTVTTSSPQLIANGTDAATITVQLKTSNGQNLNTSAGRVAFSQDASLGTIGQTTDHQDGTYTATYTAGSTAGTANISAQLNDQNLVNTVTLTLAAPEPTNAAPTIESFTISPADATNTTPTTLSWSVNDVDGDDLTCTLDVDGDGTPDYTVESCQTTTSQVHTFTVTGSYTPTLTVTDATNDPVVGPALSISVGPTLFTTLAASFSNHSLAIDNTGNAWAWGSGANGRLGTGDTANQTSPTAVGMPERITFTAITAGSSYALAVGQDGDAVGYAWSWGINTSNQLGDGTTSIRLSPVAVLMP